MSGAPGRKLPPLSPRHTASSDPDGSEEPARRKRKKKTVEGEQSGSETPRRAERSGSERRRRRGAEEDSVSGRGFPAEDPPRPRKRATPRSRTTSIGGSQERLQAEPGGRANGTAVGSQPRVNKKKPKQMAIRAKPKAKGVGTSRETLMHTEEEEGSPVKKKKKKKKQTAPLSDDDMTGGGDLGLAAELSPIKDDVVDADGSKEDIDSTYWTTPAMRSEPVGTLFIEKKSGFKAANKVKLARRLQEEQQRITQLPAAPPNETTIQFGLTTHRLFKTFTLFTHGIFAGFAFWHIIMVFTMIDRVGSATFLEYYQGIAQPVQSLYYLLFVLSTVSTFDRYDISRTNKRFIIRALTLQNGTVACLLYFVSLIISLSIAATDDKISLYTRYPDLWKDEQARSSELSTWRILNLVRGLGAILGWVVISLRPNTDRLSKNLEKADENILGDNIEIPVVRSSGV